MSAPEDIDWAAVARVFPPDPRAEAELVRMLGPEAIADADARARGMLEEARRRLHTDPAFYARVSTARQLVLRTVPPRRDPDTANHWITLGAALALVGVLRDPMTPQPQETTP